MTWHVEQGMFRETSLDGLNFSIADAAQADAIAALLTRGPKAMPYEVDFDGVDWRVKAGQSLEIESTTIKNPVTGAAVHPGAVLPEGIIFKRGDFGASSAQFDYSGPD